MFMLFKYLLRLLFKEDEYTIQYEVLVQSLQPT
jgi:hypothetical protein